MSYVIFYSQIYNIVFINPEKTIADKNIFICSCNISKLRVKMLGYIVRNNLTAAGMHIPYPATGTVQLNSKKGYIFKPVN